ncbi:MAG: excinuclease ABC subunit UvrC [Clostridia bacterium]|nr:excinuclease ABC subunit UvrC [Clostridia bacterium]
MDVLSDKLKMLPTSPGVYIMKDAYGHVIYVGKAKNLKNRVRQYFFNSVKTEKVMAMVSHIKDFDYVITDTEIDALSLENNLIKKHKPKYNILLKDDKTYPYIKINLKEDFPHCIVTRRILKDGAKYFGPFMGGINADEIKDLVNFTYKLRPCSTIISPDKTKRECLNYHIGKCLSPCSGRVSKEEYFKQVKSAIDFLSGGDDDLPKQVLNARMQSYAENEEFEAALNCREKLKSLEKLKVRRITALNNFIDADVICVASNGIYTVYNVLIIRKGRMLGAKSFDEEDASFTLEEGLRAFITRYYMDGIDLPDEILVPIAIDDVLLEGFFKEKFAKRVSILTPKQGVRKQLVEMSEKNAQDYLEKSVGKIRHKEDMTVIACQKLQRVLNLSNYPKRMECFDISHISGVDKVGSMVVFTDGVKDANEYRRFKIKTVEGNNDFECMKEVLTRRLLKLGTEEEDKFPKPDLIVIDGGKGQLSAVKEVFDKLSITGIDLISLAEREEEVFTLYSKESILIDKSDYALRLLQRLRDEAHRFAISFNRSLRGKRSLTSVLDNINGIGKVKKQALLAKFRDLSGIISATREDLLSVEGIGDKHADEILKVLKEENLIL